jgi:hypothetical protein
VPVSSINVAISLNVSDPTVAYLATHNDNNLLHYDGTQPMIGVYPIYTSLGSPQQIALVDIGSIIVADDGVEVSVERDVTAEMSDAPVAEESPITGAILKSFWQSNLIGMKVSRTISWVRPTSSSVVTMQVGY